MPHRSITLVGLLVWIGRRQIAGELMELVALRSDLAGVGSGFGLSPVLLPGTGGF